MPESKRFPREELRIFRSLLRSDLLIAGLLFLAGFGIFLAFTLPMDNQFATYARENEPMLAVWANLKTLPGYVLLATGYALLAWPFLRRRRAFREPVPGLAGRLRRGGWVLGANLVIFVTSLGLCGLGNSAFLDALTRHLAPHFPDFDFTALYRWHLLDGLAGVFLLIAAWAVWDWLGLVPRRIARSVPARGALALALLSVGVAIAAPPFGRRAPVTDAAERRPHVGDHRFGLAARRSPLLLRLRPRDLAAHRRPRGGGLRLRAVSRRDRQHPRVVDHVPDLAVPADARHPLHVPLEGAGRAGLRQRGRAAPASWDAPAGTPAYRATGPATASTWSTSASRGTGRRTSRTWTCSSPRPR